MTSRRTALLQLCECLRGERPENPDWGSLLELANHSLTTPALRDFAIKFRSHIPADVDAYIDQMFSSNLRRNERLAAQTLDAVAALNGVDVQPILLKGAGRLVTIPANQLGTRITWDLDLLVAPEDAARSVEQLRRHGYGVRSHAQDSASHWYANLERAGEVAHVDLHIRPPGYQYFQSSPATLAQHCRRVSCGTAQAWVFDPTFQSLILIVHDQLHDADYMLGKISLLHLLDLRELSNASPGIDWDLLASFFPDAFLRNALETQLVSLWALLGVDIPKRSARRFMPRLQYWRRLTQMARPWSKDALLIMTLILALPAYLSHRVRAEGMPQVRRQRERGADIAPGWSRFQFLRRLAEKERLGKLQ